MKKILKTVSSICALVLSLGTVACVGNNGGEKVANCNIFPVSYENITKFDTLEQINTYAGEISNLNVDDGVIVSPYYSLKVNGTEVPVYATRSANGIHSFVYIDVEVVDPSKEFVLQTELTMLAHSTVLEKGGRKGPTVVVLPESHGITAEIQENKVLADLKGFGSFSFAFNKSHDEPLTIFVAEKENTAEIFGDKELVYLEPGDYATLDTYKETQFTETDKVYYFKKGRYKTDTIVIPSNSVIYFEPGTYIETMPSPTGASTNVIRTGGVNVTVAGRAVFDASGCCGSEVPAPYGNNKSGFSWSGSKNVSVSGLIVINSQTWTLCFTDCTNLHIYNNMLFAYRVFADGYMLSDCKDAVVEYNFARTGDDAFETKSTSGSGLTERVLFQYNAAWTDKAVAYGCIYESNHDTRGVKFINNSVGFALGTWSPHLGCCVIQMGNRRGAVIEDILFKNMEIYASYNNAILNVFIGGSGGIGEGWGTVNNIQFKNITATLNYGSVLNVQTRGSEDAYIKHLYL
ncbi:MAG: hypothetical protein IKT32_05930, partial [Clostridia bacterium]|nr:hypothetical protein [Clostridia bacterium]